MDEAQLDFELSYIQTLDPKLKTSAKSKEGKRDHLRKHLNNTLAIDMDRTVKNFDSMLQSFRVAVEEAAEAVTDITDGTAVEEIVKSVVPEGIRVKIPERKI